ncbi:MAG: hypothetical protein COY68_03540 [Candidatus Levybacteria bacterium CG_4_10_14_0_8_um_filter_35_23]|nr:MAG: hypothetical protein COY68_03540 [Candidatus Levybacteria bacterium CG_4_10_14_0_8_um_filter_35_23]
MKILMVASFLPFPLFSGGQIRLYNIIKKLSAKHEITLICEKRNYQTDRDIEELQRFCKKVLTVERKEQWSLSNIIKTGFSFNSFLVTGHVSREMQKLIKDEIKNENYDLIHVETFYVMQNLPKTLLLTASLRSLPVVLVEHNIEHLVYKKYADKASFMLKPLLYLDVLKLKRLERLFWQKATKLVAVSEIEKKLMNRSDVVVIPNGVDLDKFKTKNIKLKTEGKKTVLFIGDFKWMQNIDAVEQILSKIWPIILEENLKTKLLIVGKKIPQKIKSFGKEGIIFDENILDSADVYKRADILLAPIRIGGGTSFKILEAMASGVAVVTTDLGIEGLGAVNGKQVLVGNNENELAKQVIRLIKENNLLRELTKNARNLIEKKYDWEKIVSVLESVYKSA